MGVRAVWPGEASPSPPPCPYPLRVSPLRATPPTSPQALGGKPPLTPHLSARMRRPPPHPLPDSHRACARSPQRGSAPPAPGGQRAGSALRMRGPLPRRPPRSSGSRGGDVRRGGHYTPRSEASGSAAVRRAPLPAPRPRRLLGPLGEGLGGLLRGRWSSKSSNSSGGGRRTEAEPGGWRRRCSPRSSTSGWSSSTSASSCPRGR